MKTILSLKFSLLVFLLTTLGIGRAAQYEENYSNLIRIGQHVFATEVANTPAKMQLGMMYRPTMQERQAMIFIYATPQKAHFWMKNTLIALDMLFFDVSGKLQEIKYNVPPCETLTCDTYSSLNNDVKYIVEIKGGVSAELGIKVGDLLKMKGW